MNKKTKQLVATLVLVMLLVMQSIVVPRQGWHSANESATHDVAGDSFIRERIASHLLDRARPQR